MKILSEKKALKRLAEIKNDYRRTIEENFQPRAKDCLTCTTKGACCLDAHFVNVRITKLEAVAAREVLQTLSPARQAMISAKIRQAIVDYGLSEEGDSFNKTFACPLFDREAGCLIHAVKPVPCIQHACYERSEDLPPDELQDAVETKIERLNRLTYGESVSSLSLPLQLAK